MPSSLARTSPHIPAFPPRVLHASLLLLIWAGIYLASLASPPLLDDADATHAQAAQAMLRTGDWVTLHVDGVRYLEKPPLPYWITAVSLRLFGTNSFAVHLPLALTVLGLAALGWAWATRAFGARAGFYTGLFTLTATGAFLFTRIFIPDALLSLLLAFAFYAALRALDDERNASNSLWAFAAWIALATAVLTKGLVALVFFFGTLLIYLPLTRSLRSWRRLSPALGICVFFTVSAPWHILAGLRNRGGANGHGFFWFYFINEHVLRFLGRRLPPDYNKLPASLYWSLHLVWLFPWSFFAPVLMLRTVRHWRADRTAFHNGTASFAARSALLLAIFSALVLVFFSLSTNQEYYTFPVYLPLLLLTAVAMSRSECDSAANAAGARTRLLILCQIALVVFGLLSGCVLGLELWTSRHLPATASVGDLLAHRNVGNYTLSMSHFFDLTSASFSALRLPAALACAALVLGPALSLVLRLRRHHLAATVTLALMSTTFLIAAHLALERFAPMLSSRAFASQIESLQSSGEVAPGTQVLIYGDQAFGSSIPFYLGREVGLVDGRSTSMLFGSTFPDAPPIFFTHQQLLANWGHGPRKLLFVPLEQRSTVDALLGPAAILVYENSGKAVFTDRSLRPYAASGRIDTTAPVQNNREQ